METDVDKMDDETLRKWLEGVNQKRVSGVSRKAAVRRGAKTDKAVDIAGLLNI